MELAEIRSIYRKTEQFTVILLILALPAFGSVYLYQNSATLSWNMPSMPVLIEYSLAAICTVSIVSHYVIFHRKIKQSFGQETLVEKVKTYCAATERRFLLLFMVSIFATIGLLFSKNPVFTIIFAVALVFFSLGKPSPDRMARLMKLKKEDRELIREASRSEVN